MKKWSWPYFILISLPLVVFIVLAFGLKAAKTPMWEKIVLIALVLIYGMVYSRLLRKIK
ncbi:hypothetical protein GTCCBUS3UF5_8010 [Geobacillus thermoleovorans CCB_US3_UF5]|uniref:Uncharacterized protein n=1 Tax=Geobacillus thermoleovorans CCB_US3_UF5 TaxID=1111068 RepID=A0ABN3ZXD9_GEOTH|nr:MULTISPECIES: hypothetical protein [Geobacillus thermoleovorans group]AEV18124.1 hypothetical protein GTCCBUS3UF5_8010 [Geobacillus thermoleovorans CCB_US3_UF5]